MDNSFFILWMGSKTMGQLDFILWLGWKNDTTSDARARGSVPEELSLVVNRLWILLHRAFYIYVKRQAWKNAGCELLATRTYALRRTLQPCAIHLGMRTGKKNGTLSLAKQIFDGDVCFVQRRQLYEWNEAWRKRFVLETNLRTTTFRRSNNRVPKYPQVSDVELTHAINGKLLIIQDHAAGRSA